METAQEMKQVENNHKVDNDSHFYQDNLLNSVDQLSEREQREGKDPLGQRR